MRSLPQASPAFCEQLAHRGAMAPGINRDDFTENFMAVAIRLSLILDRMRLGAQPLENPSPAANYRQPVQKFYRFLALYARDDRADGRRRGRFASLHFRTRQ